MTCTDFQKQLDDYLDGELQENERKLLEGHLETCLSCNRALLQVRDLVELAHRLPSEIDPDRPLWPGIESRIAPAATAFDGTGRPATSPARAWQWASLAAAAALALALAVPFMLEREDARGAAGEAAGLVDAEDTAMLARSEDGVVLPRTDLLTALERRRDTLPAAAFSQLEANARLIDQAIAEVRSALEQNPSDRRLEHLLATRYQQEVSLLKQVNRV